MAGSITPQQLERRLRAARRDYERVKQQILEVGFICEGSLVQRFMPCGKTGCRCADPGQRHGPYWQLSWKEGGKTVSRRLSPEHAALYQQWIANRHQLETLVKQMQAVSRTARQHLLDDAATTTTAPSGKHRRRT